MKRKQLSCSKEEFFTASLLAFGVPNENPLSYVHPITNSRWCKGAQAWCIYTDAGKEWMAHVQRFGEAKSRAGYWYVCFQRWYRQEKQREASARERSQSSATPEADDETDQQR